MQPGYPPGAGVGPSSAYAYAAPGEQPFGGFDTFLILGYLKLPGPSAETWGPTLVCRPDPGAPGAARRRVALRCSR